MAGILNEYGPFVEMQQRRARVVADLLTPPPTAPEAGSSQPLGDTELIYADRDETGATTTQGTRDVR
jgi:hypothetical protein